MPEPRHPAPARDQGGLWLLDERERGYLLALLARMPARDPATYPPLVADPQVQFLLDCAADVVAFLG